MENKKSILVKASVFLFIIILTVFGAIIINRKEAQIKELNAGSSNLSHLVAERDSMLNGLFNSFNEIETSLDFIKLRRNQIEIIQDEGTVSQQETILNDIKLLDSLLEKNAQKMKDLESRLKTSGVQIAAFNTKISLLNNNIEQQNTEILKLKNRLTEREEEIADLNEQVNGLESEISRMDTRLEEKAVMIRKQDDELNRAFLAYGSFKELKENGVVKRDGGFLGIGGTKLIPGTPGEDYFLPIDIRETREIPLFSKKVNFITEHPDSSYRFLINEGLVTYLEIENPKEFWKYSKYAVIETR